MGIDPAACGEFLEQRAIETARGAVPAPPASADGAAFALKDIRWPGWMWCSTLPEPLCQGEMENAHRLRVRRLTPELSASPG